MNQGNRTKCPKICPTYRNVQSQKSSHLKWDKSGQNPQARPAVLRIEDEDDIPRYPMGIANMIESTTSRNTKVMRKYEEFLPTGKW